MRATSSHVASAVHLDRSLFEAAPAAVVFQSGGAGAGAPAAASLRLRNLDRVPRHVRVLPPDPGSGFSVDGPYDGRGARIADGGRVAPGTEAVFRVRWMPHPRRPPARAA
jgi:hypothetical protein